MKLCGFKLIYRSLYIIILYDGNVVQGKCKLEFGLFEFYFVNTKVNLLGLRPASNNSF